MFSASNVKLILSYFHINEVILWNTLLKKKKNTIQLLLIKKSYITFSYEGITHKLEKSGIGIIELILFSVSILKQKYCLSNTKPINCCL